jgi:ribosomal protein L35
MAHKSYTKRIRETKNGKLLIRTAGHNHFNSKEPREKQLKRKRMGNVLSLTAKRIGRYLRG